MDQTKSTVQYSLAANGENGDAATDCQDKTDAREVKRPLKTFICIISWYTSNIGVIILNKYLISNYEYRCDED